MADIRSLRTNESLESHWEDLVYTEALLLRHPKAKGLADLITEKIRLAEETMKGQRRFWHAEVVVQSRVDLANAALDDEVRLFSESLKSVIRKEGTLRPEDSPRFVRYFKIAPNRVVRMALEASLRYMRTWPESLAGEPEQELRDYAERFRQLLQEGDEALKERLLAQSATADHRVREIHKFVKETNRSRTTLYAELLRRESEEGLPAGWASSFFRKSIQSDGESRDLCRGKAQAVLGFLAARGISLSDEQKKAILDETSAETLDLYIQRAASVTSLDALLAA